jgi:hypothetical protein
MDSESIHDYLTQYIAIPANRKKSGDKGKDKRKDTRKCYICNETGHISPNCPKKPTNHSHMQPPQQQQQPQPTTSTIGIHPAIVDALSAPRAFAPHQKNRDPKIYD